MLSTVFGWTQDIEELVRDEMNRHPAGSANRILLAKWLGDMDIDIIATSSKSMTSSDWMLLALSGIGNQASQHNLGRAYTQRLLESGDLHAAATIMIGMGDYNDAIEIYGSHHKYMEALIVACLFYPSVWERQSHLVKKWGEWAIKNGQRELAIRCFACTGKEATEPWTSPSAAQINFQSIQGTVPEALSPPLSPPSNLAQRGPQRSIAKSSALRLITNFGDDSAPKAKFFSGQDGDGATPIAAGITPILDSALSPSGAGGDVTTAFLRPSQRSAFNTPSSARSGVTPFGRQRLPSIGEAPADASHPKHTLKQKSVDLSLPTPPVDGADRLHAHTRSISPKAMAVDDSNIDSNGDANYMIGMTLQRASTSSPLYRRKEPPPSPSPASLAMLMEGRTSRNGPRERIPTGVDLQIETAKREAMRANTTSPEQSASANRYRWPSRRRGPASVSSSITSTSSANAHGSRSHRFRTGDVANTSKTLDEYINSLEAAKLRARPSSRERERQQQRSREASRRRRPSTGASETSGAPTPTPSSQIRDGPATADDRSWAPTPSRGYASSKSGGKRSPRSPVPMSPEDLINLGAQGIFGRDDNIAQEVPAEVAPLAVVKGKTTQHGSRPSSRSRPNSRTSSRGRASATGRHRSPERRPPALDIPRGRNDSRVGSVVRSPSSPLPFSSNAAPYYNSEDDDADYQKAVDAQERFRNRDKSHTHGNKEHREPREHSSGRSRREPSPGSVAPEREKTGSRRRMTADATPAAPVSSSTSTPAVGHRRERQTPGPPPAPSAIAVAAGIGFDKGPTPVNGEDYVGRRRSLSATSHKGSMNDLKQLSKDERAMRKAAAARELEERRKSLVRRPLAPAVMHPDELSPATGTSPFSQLRQEEVQQKNITEMFELNLPNKFAAPQDLPTRSHSTEPEIKAQVIRARSMFATRGPSIGLPATPKAMRLVMEAGANGGMPSVPPIPASFSYHKSPPPPMSTSPKEVPFKMEEKVSHAPAPAPILYTTSAPAPVPAPALAAAPAQQEETLTLLPSTVYQPPSRSAIPRSMSAPPVDLSFPVKPSSPPKSSHEGPSRADSVPVQGETAYTSGRRPSADDLIPPPPRPPMLKELAHLAMPPPPPPAPLPFGSHNSPPMIYGGHTTGTIEVVMDDGEVQPIVTMSPPPMMQQATSIPPPPPPPPAPSTGTAVSMSGMSPTEQRIGHRRGRSSTDNSIAGRISRATERMRSASRGRNNMSAASRTKSPESAFAPYESIPIPQNKQPEMMFVPYESVPPPPPMPTQLSPQQQQQQAFRTGLHQSEMI